MRPFSNLLSPFRSPAHAAAQTERQHLPTHAHEAPHAREGNWEDALDSGTPQIGRSPASSSNIARRPKTVLAFVKNAKDKLLAPAKGNSKLHLAAKEGDLEKFLNLLSKPHHRSDINAQNNSGKTPLCYAAKHGRLEIVEALANNPFVDGVVLNMADKKGRTPLSYAVGKGHVEIINALLANPHIDVDKADEKGRTPISYAAEMGSFDLVNILLSAGANPNLPDKEGRTPLDYAAKHGHFEAARTLVGNEQTLLNLKARNGKAPLHRAIENKHHEIVRLLAAQGSRIDLDLEGRIGKKDSRTALTYAAGKGRSDVVQILLTAGTDPNKSDGEGNAPLHQAVRKERPETVRILLNPNQAHAGRINLNQRDGSRNTALHLAVRRHRSDPMLAVELKSVELPRDKEMVRMLLSQVEAGRLDPLLQNSEGFTPLALAIKNGNFSLTDLLLGNRVVNENMNLPNNKGETPFFLSIDYLSHLSPTVSTSIYGHVVDAIMKEMPCYKLLMNNRTDLRHPTRAGKTPFEHLVGIAERQRPESGQISLARRFLGEVLKNPRALQGIPEEVIRKARRYVQ